MIQVFHAFGSKDKGYEFLKKLQANNRRSLVFDR